MFSPTKCVTIALLAVTITGGVIATFPQETRADFAISAQSVLADAVAHLGGDEKAAERTAAYEAAIAAGVPLADAGLTEAQTAEFTGLGSNVVVPCDSAAGHPEIAEINSMLTEAGGDAVLCGGYNAELDPQGTLAENATSCAGQQSVVESALVNAGGNGWKCEK